MEKMYNEFINLYSMSKTIRNGLVPTEITKKYINKNGVLEKDGEKALDYEKLKKLCDIEHKFFIEGILRALRLKELDRIAELYNKIKRDDKEQKELDKLLESSRKFISEAFKKNKEYKKLFGKEMITEKLTNRYKEKAEFSIIEKFLKFTTYMKGFNENRRNIYAKDGSSTAIAYRIMEENFPRFLENKKVYEKIKESPLKDKLPEIEKGLKFHLGEKTFEEIFSIEGFNEFLSQSGIDFYNEVIGGYTTKEKVKGINEYINEYNQNCSKKERIRKLKPLFKQILSDRETSSFIPEALRNDNEALIILKDLQEYLEENIINREVSIEKLFKNLKEYDLDKIYVRNDSSLTKLSQMMFGDWSVITSALEKNYDSENIVLETEKYRKEKENYLKKRKSFSLMEINLGLEKLGEEKKVEDFFEKFLKTVQGQEKDYIEDIEEKYNNLKGLLENTVKIHEKGLSNDIESKELIKAYLDAWKDLQRFIKLLLGDGKEEEKDEKFYSELEAMWIELDKLTTTYNKIRNYVTKKPYSTEKIKLNFFNPKLLDGWAKNKEITNSCLIFRGKYGKDIDEYYYLGIINTEFNNDFKEYKSPYDTEDVFEKMVYLQAADPLKEVQNFMRIDGKVEKKNGSRNAEGVNEVLEGLKNTYLPTKINRIRKERTFAREDKEKFNKDDLTAFIDFYKELAIEYYADYDFTFKNSEEYNNFKEFTDHINKQAYQIRFEKVSRRHIETLEEAGKLYLFKIYNKDFSPKSKGTKNLHTMYFKALFDEKNLENVVYKLNGQAEIFFRKKSLDISKTKVHEANKPMDNKLRKEGNTKTTAVYKYDIIKDRRYTKDTFHFHFPITLNFSADEVTNINERVNKTLKAQEDVYIIGIDRGERNLIYVSVINEKGEIVEQKSFNVIKKNESDSDGKNYHEAIEEKAKKRANARLNWDNIEGIKQIKEGYLSQVIHQICLMMEKYNGIVVLENLNGGFKNSRKKFEVSMYQKFEKMLIEKLNYYVNKQKPEEECGGLMKAYQLTNKFESFKKLGKQSGFLYYVDPWDTSKIDPTTGFVNLYNFKYENVEKAKNIIEKLDRIEYNHSEGYFEIDIDYSKFGDRVKGSKQKWTLCTVGERIIRVKNGNYGDTKIIEITKEFKKLLEEKNISIIEDDIKEELLRSNSKELLKGVIDLLKITIQLRNSSEKEGRDYIQSPVKNKMGNFYNSEIYKIEKEKTKKEVPFPIDADANGAYNIAKKGLMIVQIIKSSADSEMKKLKLNITREEWLKFAQKN